MIRNPPTSTDSHWEEDGYLAFEAGYSLGRDRSTIGSNADEINIAGWCRRAKHCVLSVRRMRQLAMFRGGWELGRSHAGDQA